METSTSLRVNPFFLSFLPPFLDFLECLILILCGVVAIRKKVRYDWEFNKICYQYTDFSTGWSVLHHAVGIGHFEMCKFLIKNVKVFTDPLTYKSILSLSLSFLLAIFMLFSTNLGVPMWLLMNCLHQLILL